MGVQKYKHMDEECAHKGPCIRGLHSPGLEIEKLQKFALGYYWSLAVVIFFVLILSVAFLVMVTTDFNYGYAKLNSSALEARRLGYCKALLGRYVDNEWEGLEETFNFTNILETYGGAPGKVNVTRRTIEEIAPIEDPTVRPLPEVQEQYWIYNYWNQSKIFARQEYAVRRKSDTFDFIEIRGKIFFPIPICRMSRYAEYSVDDRGLVYNVLRGLCKFHSNNRYFCKLPPLCHKHDIGIDCSRSYPERFKMLYLYKHF